MAFKATPRGDVPLSAVPSEFLDAADDTARLRSLRSLLTARKGGKKGKSKSTELGWDLVWEVICEKICGTWVSTLHRDIDGIRLGLQCLTCPQGN